MSTNRNKNKDGRTFKIDRSFGKKNASAQTISWAHMGDNVKMIFFIFYELGSRVDRKTLQLESPLPSDTLRYVNVHISAHRSVIRLNRMTLS